MKDQVIDNGKIQFKSGVATKKSDFSPGFFKTGVVFVDQDMPIIEVAKLTTIPGSQYAYFCVSAGAMVTALYTFRALFMTFHGTPRMDAHTFAHVHESPWVVWLPLVLLAIPSVIIGFILYMPMLFHVPSFLGNAITVLPSHNQLPHLDIHSPIQAIWEAFATWTFWATLGSIFVAWICYLKVPSIPGILARTLSVPYRILVAKYGFDALNNVLFVKGTREVGEQLYEVGDQKVIDGFFVNGTAKLVGWFSSTLRFMQSGYLYQYIAVMVFGLFGFLCWLLLR